MELATRRRLALCLKHPRREARERRLGVPQNTDDIESTIRRRRRTSWRKRERGVRASGVFVRRANRFERWRQRGVWIGFVFVRDRIRGLALVFALHHYKPTPLYVMDEIDAALDFRNVSIVGNYIKERTRNAQFIIISLRNNMFELADRLVGIYKTNNCTKSVAINPHAFTISAR